MLEKMGKAGTIAQQTKRRLSLMSFRTDKPLTAEDVQVARDYIAAYWHKLERTHPKDDGSALGLPNAYIVPAYEEGLEFDFNELYYWDSYFMCQGFMGNGTNKDLVIGILENLASLYERLRVIPNASRTYLTGRSQPPLFTSFILEAYTAYNMDKKWLKSMMEIAEQEYHTVWMGVSKPNARQMYRSLSRYYDINMTHDLAEAESGWDYTPRFARKALNYLPVDLNALLYKYELDFAKVARIFDNKREAAQWEQTAKARKKTMHELMWDRSRGFFYDYNYVREKRGNVNSLAGFFPMWFGMVDGKDAQEMVKALRRFENKGGLSTTDALPLGQFVTGSMPTQWAYPNGWAPLHLMVIQALERYNYHNDAKRLATKWLKTNLHWFNAHGVFLEKYNVVNPEKPPAKGVYPSQSGFGWTNAVFERLCQQYIDHA